jgi:hypothetical protein
MEKKYAIATSSFGDKYSTVITSWEINEENGERINQNSKTFISISIEDALDKINKIILE